MTAEDTKNLKQYGCFRKLEQDVYKELHDKIIDDHGVSNLQKRQYNMPGYTEVLKHDGERKTYELEA